MTSPLRRALWRLVRSPLDGRRDQTLDELAALAPMLEDGGALTAAIRAERLIPLAYVWLRALRRERPASVTGWPPRFWEGLGSLYQRVIGHNLHMIAGWRRIQEVLDAAGVAAIPIKGPVLSALAYDDAALRQVDDLDAIISVGDLPSAAAALLAAGHRQARGPAPERREAYARSLQDWLFVDPAERVLDIKPVPISHTMAGPRGVERLRERLTDVALDAAGTVWRAPDRVAMTILAGMHGAGDGWCSVRHVADIAGLATRLTAEEWQELAETATTWRQLRAVAGGLALARRFDLLPEVSPWVGHALTRAQRRWLDGAEIRLSAESPMPYSPLRAWRSRLLSCDGARERWRCAWRQVMVPSASDWERLPGWWPSPAVLLYRPLRLWGMRGKIAPGAPPCSPRK